MRNGFKLLIVLLVVAMAVMLVGPTLWMLLSGNGAFDPSQ